MGILLRILAVLLGLVTVALGAILVSAVLDSNAHIIVWRFVVGVILTFAAFLAMIGVWQAASRR